MNKIASRGTQTYYFKKEQKKELLSGRTIVFLANEIGVSYVYLTNVLNGKVRCSQLLANNLWYKALKFRPFEYFFKKEE